MSSIDGEPTHAINEVGFDRHLFVTHGEYSILYHWIQLTTIVNFILVGDGLCESPQLLLDSMPNVSGYVYWVGRQKGIVRRCPSDTVVSFEVGGCVNRTSKYIYSCL
jgi:hypothetical protein